MSGACGCRSQRRRQINDTTPRHHFTQGARVVDGEWRHYLRKMTAVDFRVLLGDISTSANQKKQRSRHLSYDVPRHLCHEQSIQWGRIGIEIGKER
jgi:hypothetical protein